MVIQLSNRCKNAIEKHLQKQQLQKHLNNAKQSHTPSFKYNGGNYLGDWTSIEYLMFKKKVSVMK